ncbi:hypothetical protein OG911_16630 [Streptomyces sp. NBC_00208]|uniref:hypothetical protein n=1 Tax=Streptomyces sp. NBC_00208 TaxID=2975681 RepID=UPI002E2C96E5|nr:hypothetical protein [Streptomyces sp. NBC_00208]
MNHYLGRDLASINPFTIPPDMTRDEHKAYLSRLFDFTGALLSRGTLPAGSVERLTSLRSEITAALL